MDWSNIETIVGIIITILGVPSVIGGSVLAIRKLRHPKTESDEDTIEGNNEMNDSNKSTKNNTRQIATGNATNNSTTTNVTNDNSTNISTAGNTELTINFPVDLDQKKDDAEITPGRKIHLHSTYTSLYAESGKLQREIITLDETNIEGKVSGKIKLVTGTKKEEYLLSATFFNKVINGVYYSSDTSVDECGTINLKQVSDDIYSGFCTFTKIGSDGKEVVKSSPYVWVKGDEKNLLCGTYDFCKDCPTQTDMCCCASERVDMPVLLYDEVSNLRDKNDFKVRYNIGTFAKKIDNSPIYQMKHKKDKRGSDPDHCFFFDYDKKKCLVYDYRPIDCRLFPFDIRLNNKNRPGQKQNPDNEYWIGYYPGLCKRNLPSKEEMEKQVAILRPYFYLLAPFVDSYTRSDVFSRLDNEDFEMLYKLRDVIY